MCEKRPDPWQRAGGQLIPTGENKKVFRVCLGKNLAVALLPFDPADAAQLEHQVLGSGKVAPPVGTKKAAEFWAGRWALVSLLPETPSLQVRVHPEGYVELDRGEGVTMSPLWASVAHTKGLAVAALGTAPVGIDVERAGRAVPRTVHRVLSNPERTFWNRQNALSEMNSDVSTSWWCAKEAVLKAMRLGLQGAARIALEPDADQDFAVRLVEDPSPHGADWEETPFSRSITFVRTWAWRGYRFAVASERAHFECSRDLEYLRKNE
jgi:phosphopantetheinyl transferase